MADQHLLIHLIGPARAKPLVAGGGQLPVETLLDWGILDALVPRDQLSKRAREFAEIHADKPDFTGN
jgi:enoyl-CoA hydratase/carnithine racemase